MFNKKNNIKEINLIQGKLYQYNDILISRSFVNMMADYHYNKNVEEKMDYQSQLVSYINKKHEYRIKKQYNPKIIKLYQEGLLIIDKEEYLLKELFIVFNDNINNFHLKSKYDKLNSPDDDYNKAIRFIDTTAFIKLINKEEVTIRDNKIIINNIDVLNEVIKNWDGYLHSEIEETDAITNKKMIKGDINE